MSNPLDPVYPPIALATTVHPGDFPRKYNLQLKRNEL